MALVSMRANMAGDYAALRDDAGLRYTLKCAAAEFRAALSLDLLCKSGELFS
jgi:hypothetical protein